MSSALAALSPEERAELAEAMQYRHLERMLVHSGLRHLLAANLIKVVRPPTPAVGTDWAVTIPAGTIWEVLNVWGLFTASAVVGTRLVSVRATDGDRSDIAFYSAAGTVAASAASRLIWAAGLGAAVTNAVLTAPLPDPPLPLVGGSQLKAVTSSLDTGDQWSSVTLIVREWSPPAIVYTVRDLLIDLDSAGGIY